MNMENFDSKNWKVADYFGTDGRWHTINNNNSDDGYDAARDAYDAYHMGYGPPVTRRQHEEEDMLREEYRRNGW